MTTVRTRFAPSPTGYLHVGGARTALFSWAYARHARGQFILRIEDTDVARSTPEAVDAILKGMHWLGLDHDEGPFFQMSRMPRYQSVLEDMLAQGLAYYCYASQEEIDMMRDKQRALGLKPRYDGTWRPEPGKILPPIPENRRSVIRFKQPQEGQVVWHDLVKGTVCVSNSELDDLILARSDGTPTYNFCVAVDDWDMAITHVIRGDDHVNNTPRQINILLALGATLPHYAHVPMILGSDGEKLSKRHGAVSVMEYEKDYLPEALLNYLGRLGWSHGDDEIFTIEDMCRWFDLTHLASSAAQFDSEKLKWLNNQYIKQADNTRLAACIRPHMADAVFEGAPPLEEVVALFKERVHTLTELAQHAMLFYREPVLDGATLKTYLSPTLTLALQDFLTQVHDIAWHKASIATLIQSILAKHALKMPQLAMPLRLLVVGQLHTPSLDSVLALLCKQVVISRIKEGLDHLA